MMKRGGSRLSPEYALLGFLYRAPSHGYELHQRLQEQFGSIWHASQSQTYNILKRLDSQGYIRSTVVEQEKLPARQDLSITLEGTQRFEDWLWQPTNASVHAIRVEFITRLYFVQQYAPERAPDLIEGQARAVKMSMHSIEQQLSRLAEGQVYNHLALQLRLELLGSVMHWLESCGQIISTGGSSATEAL